MTGITDEQLMETYRRCGDRESIAALMRRHGPRAAAVAFQFLRDRNDAQDMVQEAFIRVIRSSHQFGRGLSFAPWFYRIVRNACLDALRRRKTYERALEKFDPGVEHDETGGDETYVGIREAMRTLPEKDQRVLSLRIDAGLSLEEIAAVCGCSEEAAKKRAQRGLKRLKTLVETRRSGQERDEMSRSATACVV